MNADVFGQVAFCEDYRRLMVYVVYSWFMHPSCQDLHNGTQSPYFIQKNLQEMGTFHDQFLRVKRKLLRGQCPHSALYWSIWLLFRALFYAEQAEKHAIVC